ncbi:MAG: heat-inducible transcriptional repressor HrcA [Syntrophomonadaceae bacterium]|nr:heat-inducible transcriptional repressor HrcA [Syntrophomonadaceae bacterium]
MSLDERKKLILESIIRDYIETAEPVGSRTVVRKHAMNISAATVRNEMADLEMMGYLEQPHTSAGRIPSQLGFRYYVDWMMEKENISAEEMEALYAALNSEEHDWQQVVSEVVQFMARVSNYAAFIVVPPLRISQFRYLQLVPLNSHEALVLLLSDNGLVLHRRMSLPESVKMEDLQQIGEQFNNILRGRRMAELKKTDLRKLRSELSQKRRLIDRMLDSIDDVLDNKNDEKLLVSGALNILKEPEFKDVEKLHRILMILEEEDLLRGMIPAQLKDDDVDILIGKENRSEDIQDLSMVLSSWKSSDEPGRIGLIGPVRMAYGKAAGTVEAVRNILQEILKSYY